MSRARVASEFRPWAGLVVGLLALSFVHQFGSDTVFDACNEAAPGPVMLAAIAGLLLCALAGLVSWGSIRTTNGTRRVIAIMSVGCAMLFAFAIILPIMAALMLPPCFG